MQVRRLIPIMGSAYSHPGDQLVGWKLTVTVTVTVTVAAGHGVNGVPA